MLYDFSFMSLIHFAPERSLSAISRNSIAEHRTADLAEINVDYHVDIRSLPFANGTFDCVYASHVLEHIREDRVALSEIRRILKPGGLAILPLPFVCDRDD